MSDTLIEVHVEGPQGPQGVVGAAGVPDNSSIDLLFGLTVGTIQNWDESPSYAADTYTKHPDGKIYRAIAFIAGDGPAAPVAAQWQLIDVATNELRLQVLEDTVAAL